MYMHLKTGSLLQYDLICARHRPPVAVRVGGRRSCMAPGLPDWVMLVRVVTDGEGCALALRS